MSWTSAHLADLVDAKPGFACGENVVNGVFQFRMNNVTTEGALDLSRQRRVPVNSRKLDSFLLQPGDVLFNATNSPELVGKTAFFSGLEEPATYSNHFLRLRPTVSIDGRYLARWLTWQYERKTFLGLCRQWVNQASVSREALLNLAIPVPPLAEQQRIAAILDQADGLRAKRRSALAKLETLSHSVFLDMFGDTRDNPNKWLMRPFVEVCPTHLGKMLDAKQQTGKYLRPYVRNVNVQWLSLDLSDVAEMDFSPNVRNKYRLVDGDLLICEGGEPGRAAIWHGEIEECYFQKAVHRGRPIQGVATPEYLVMLLWFLSKRGVLADHITSATIAHLTGDKMKKMLIPVPPITLQEQFSQMLQAIQNHATLERRSASQFADLFASLQHRAFRGEL